MTDRAALLAAIAADTESDTPRLIFADWLDEQGEHGWAEFLRIQCTLQRMSLADDRRTALTARAADLAFEQESAWLGELASFARDWDWQRGFPRRITTTLMDHTPIDAFQRVFGPNLPQPRWELIDWDALPLSDLLREEGPSLGLDLRAQSAAPDLLDVLLQDERLTRRIRELLLPPYLIPAGQFNALVNRRWESLEHLCIGTVDGIAPCDVLYELTREESFPRLHTIEAHPEFPVLSADLAALADTSLGRRLRGLSIELLDAANIDRVRFPKLTALTLFCESMPLRSLVQGPFLESVRFLSLAPRLCPQARSDFTQFFRSPRLGQVESLALLLEQPDKQMEPILRAPALRSLGSLLLVTMDSRDDSWLRGLPSAPFFDQLTRLGIDGLASGTESDFRPLAAAPGLTRLTHLLIGLGSSAIGLTGVGRLLVSRHFPKQLVELAIAAESPSDALISGLGILRDLPHLRRLELLGNFRAADDDVVCFPGEVPHLTHLALSLADARHPIATSRIDLNRPLNLELVVGLNTPEWSRIEVASLPILDQMPLRGLRVIRGMGRFGGLPDAAVPWGEPVYHFETPWE